MSQGVFGRRWQRRIGGGRRSGRGGVEVEDESEGVGADQKPNGSRLSCEEQLGHPLRLLWEGGRDDQAAKFLDGFTEAASREICRRKRWGDHCWRFEVPGQCCGSAKSQRLEGVWSKCNLSAPVLAAKGGRDLRRG